MNKDSTLWWLLRGHITSLRAPWCPGCAVQLYLPAWRKRPTT